MHLFLAPDDDPSLPVVVHLLPGVASRSLLGFVRENRLGRETMEAAPAGATLDAQRRWFERWWPTQTGAPPPGLRCVALYEAGPLVAATPESVRALALVRDPIDLALRLAEAHGAPPTSWSNPQARALLAGHVDDVDALPADPDHSEAGSWRRRLATLVAKRYVLGECARMPASTLRFAHELGWPVAAALCFGQSGDPPVELDHDMLGAIRRRCWLDAELAAVASTDLDHFLFDELPDRREAERGGTRVKIKQRGGGPATRTASRYRSPPAAPEDPLHRARRAETRVDWIAARIAVMDRRAKSASPAEAAVPAKGNGAGPREHMIMHGRDGWLFVAHDSTDMANQLTGRRVLTGGQRKGWVKALRARTAAVGEHGCRYVFAVAPATHHVFPEHLPPGLKRVSPRPIERIAAAMADDGDGLPPLVYPLAVLRAAHDEGHPPASRVDSHWNDWGAFLGYREVMAALPADLPARRLERGDLVLREAVVTGDLGARVAPPMSAETVIADLAESSIEVVEDNRVHNAGRIARFHNPDAPDACCVLIGSSSAGVALKFFAASFRTLVYAFARSEFDCDFVRESAADVAISLINERYLIVQPDKAATPPLRETARLRAAKGLAVSEKRAVRLYAGWATPRQGCYEAPG